MPTYVYEREDGTKFELTQKITEDALSVCPDTGQKVKRVITGGNFILKGSGWYKDGYSGNGSSASSSGSGDGEAKTEKKTSDSESTPKSDTASKPADSGCTGTPSSCGCSSKSSTSD